VDLESITVPSLATDQTRIPGDPFGTLIPFNAIGTELCVCGDGIIQAGEECDGAATGTCAGGCEPDCKCTPVKVPTVSAWGMVALILVPLTGIAVNRVRKFRRDRAAVS